MNLRRKVGYKERRADPAKKASPHGPERGHAVFLALSSLEEALGKDVFSRLFELLLTDNGAEFSDHAALERSALPSRRGRCKVYYCDVHQAQQKAGCERNHAELRKLLPKSRGLSFVGLEPADLAVAMLQLNSEPRPSLAGMPPARMLLAAYGRDGRAPMDALGCGRLPCGELGLSVLLASRQGCGERPLARPSG